MLLPSFRERVPPCQQRQVSTQPSLVASADILFQDDLDRRTAGQAKELAPENAGRPARCHPVDLMSVTSARAEGVPSHDRGGLGRAVQTRRMSGRPNSPYGRGNNAAMSAGQEAMLSTFGNTAGRNDRRLIRCNVSVNSTVAFCAQPTHRASSADCSSDGECAAEVIGQAEWTAGHERPGGNTDAKHNRRSARREFRECPRWYNDALDPSARSGNRLPPGGGLPP
jgi:hypothetical protein